MGSLCTFMQNLKVYVLMYMHNKNSVEGVKYITYYYM